MMPLATAHAHQTMPDLSDYMTTDQAAARLGFHVKSVRNMVAAGTLQGVKVGRSVMVLRSSVTEYEKRTKGMSKTDPRRSQ